MSIDFYTPRNSQVNYFFFLIDSNLDLKVNDLAKMIGE